MKRLPFLKVVIQIRMKVILIRICLSKPKNECLVSELAISSVNQKAGSPRVLRDVPVEQSPIDVKKEARNGAEHVVQHNCRTLKDVHEQKSKYRV